MIRYRLGPQDLAAVRFAISPLWEAVEALAVLTKGDDHHPAHRPWVEEARRAVEPLDLTLLRAVLNVRGWLPDFLLPPPIAPYPRFADELDRVRAIAPQDVHREVTTCLTAEELAGDARPFVEEPAAALARAADLLEAFWEVALAGHWPRIAAFLERDVLHRARMIAQRGPEALFADLHPQVRYADGWLEVEKHHDAEIDARGRGVLLIPVAFGFPGIVATTEDPIQPTVAYGPRGVAELWVPRTVESGEALRSLVGPARAAVLGGLRGPRSTTELAGRLGVTPGAVSQSIKHLERLGLVEGMRVGRHVYYRRSARGETLLQLFAEA